MLEENLLNIDDNNSINNIQIYLEKNIKIWCYICAIIVGAIIWHYSSIYSI